MFDAGAVVRVARRRAQHQWLWAVATGNRGDVKVARSQLREGIYDRCLLTLSSIPLVKVASSRPLRVRIMEWSELHQVMKQCAEKLCCPPGECKLECCREVVRRSDTPRGDFILSYRVVCHQSRLSSEALGQNEIFPHAMPVRMYHVGVNHECPASRLGAVFPLCDSFLDFDCRTVRRSSSWCRTRLWKDHFDVAEVNEQRDGLAASATPWTRRRSGSWHWSWYIWRLSLECAPAFWAIYHLVDVILLWQTSSNW